MVTQLQGKGYQVFDMTENEAAKYMCRHMVGGHRRRPSAEMLFRFEFPERPGALLQFLSGLGSDWNISLFHYRNHGSAWGRVLVGFDAGSKDKRSCRIISSALATVFGSKKRIPRTNCFCAEVCVSQWTVPEPADAPAIRLRRRVGSYRVCDRHKGARPNDQIHAELRWRETPAVPALRPCRRRPCNPLGHAAAERQTRANPAPTSTPSQ